MTFDYDDDTDVLYLVFSETTEACKNIETGPGDILRARQATGEVVGCTIPFFLHRSKQPCSLFIPDIDRDSISHLKLTS